MLGPTQTLLVAGRLIGGVAGELVGRGQSTASAFASILGDQPPPADTTASVLDSTDQTTAIGDLESDLRRSLNDWWIRSPFADQPLPTLRIDNDGEVRVVDDHPSAAAIEQDIAADQAVTNAVARWQRHAAPQRVLEVALTPNANHANITNVAVEVHGPSLRHPGGYANW